MTTLYHVEMSLEGKRIGVLVDHLYEELELWYPYYRFQEAGAESILIGSKAGESFNSKVGYPAIAERSFEDIAAGDLDGIVIPGGYAPDKIRRHEAALQLVKQVNDAGKLVASICHGPWVLCSVKDLLRERQVTSFFAIKDDVVNAGANWQDAVVVVDRNLVTSRKPADLPAFTKASLEVLSKQK